MNLSDGSLKRDRFLRTGLCGVKSPNIIKVFEILDNAVPLCDGQQDGLAVLVLVDNKFWM